MSDLVERFAENHRQRAALMAIRELLGYAANEGKSLAVKESNANQAWHRADSALSQSGGPDA